MRQLVSGVTAPARFWPQVRSRRRGHEGHKCDFSWSVLRPHMQLSRRISETALRKGRCRSRSSGWGHLCRSGIIAAHAEPQKRLSYRRCENSSWAVRLTLKRDLAHIFSHFSLGWEILESFKWGFSSSMPR